MIEASDEAPRWIDVALAVCLAVFAQLDVRFTLDNSTHYGSDFATASVVAFATLATAWSRRRPLMTLFAVVAAVTVPELFTRLTITLWGHFVPLLVCVYAVARRCDTARAAGAVLLAFGAIAVLMLRVPSLSPAANIPFTAVPITVAFIAGQVLQRRQSRHEELATRASQLEVNRESEISAAVAEERNRIARELHDIVAHCVSVMVVQAGAAEDLLDRDPDRAREPLRAVQETGQQAVAELGRMLGLLRGAEPATGRPERGPQPGTAQLPELADRMSGLGLPVQLTVSGAVRSLAPGIELTAYRLVQEALTNTLKHGGPGVKAHVDLHYDAHTLDVHIVDNGHAAGAAGCGHGLIGMTERTSIYGGAITAGSEPSGGFRVHATLPLDPP